MYMFCLQDKQCTHKQNNAISARNKKQNSSVLAECTMCLTKVQTCHIVISEHGHLASTQYRTEIHKTHTLDMDLALHITHHNTHDMCWKLLVLLPGAVVIEW